MVEAEAIGVEAEAIGVEAEAVDEIAASASLLQILMIYHRSNLLAIGVLNRRFLTQQ